ncbi:MAG TPA: ribosome-associated translation inhibitor RaiA [Candidatus Paceibacterota bacterium]|nr:ribosome-associated translation inhibitor RaiA [Candidatus Paceibacterota bacterium]HPT17895.1 ribosome-associated translation inhibitor RaiA [Candidatus Paceibacterota bacterium]
MQINLLGKNIEITPAIHDYVVKRLTNLGKILTRIEEEGGDVKVFFEVGKSTKHHKSGDFFHSDCSVSIKGENYYASADKPDLYEAVDAVKENLYSKISRRKERKLSRFNTGARKIKDMVRGFRNWKK